MNLELDLAKIALQEQTLCFEKFDEKIAWELGGLLRAAAEKRGAALAIDIFAGGHSVFTCALPGASPNNANWVRRKRNTVLHFHRSSYGLGLQLEREKTDLATKFGLSLADYAVHGGGFPLRLLGAGVIGAITVSGLPQREDHKLVVSVLAEFLGKSPSELKLE
ncbi:MAG: heme-degrading domain-containing protein [Nibricoccus sp.]